MVVASKAPHPAQAPRPCGRLDDLRVDAGRLDMLVSQKLTDFDQRRAVLKQLSRQRMAQEMGALERGLKPGAVQSSRHDRRDALTIGESTVGGSRPDKDLTRCARWSPCPTIGDERL